MVYRVLGHVYMGPDKFGTGLRLSPDRPCHGISWKYEVGPLAKKVQVSCEREGPVPLWIGLTEGHEQRSNSVNKLTLLLFIFNNFPRLAE